ncbi:MAG: HypC/HybG/HupF family hydrogenase formation chaperone [Deltaproteobacteria bacterium]|nr:HypC/HybG/HupF family hydrogenase formation chaperone [Deltaproteobacteria bacterium]
MCLAVPGRILECLDRDGLRFAKVDFGGVRKEVCLETSPEAAPGDWVLVHVGFALRVLDEAAAREIHAAFGVAGDA